MGQRTEVDLLMHRLASGDRSAFTPLFRALWGPTLHLCQRLVPHSDDAVDAAQTSMLRLFERAAEYDVQRPALPWALGIAAWECRTLRTRRQRSREVSEPVGVDDGGAAAQEVEQRELTEAALHALGTLSEVDQRTLLAS